MNDIDWALSALPDLPPDRRRPLRDGFELRRQSGSHQRFVHPDGRRVTVSSHHSGQTFPPKTLRSMVKEQAALVHRGPEAVEGA